MSDERWAMGLFFLGGGMFCVPIRFSIKNILVTLYTSGFLAIRELLTQ